MSGYEGSGQQVEATRKRKWGGGTVGTGEMEGEDAGRGEEEEAEKVKHGKKGEGGRSFPPWSFLSWVGCSNCGEGGWRLAPRCLGSMHLWYLAESQLSLEIEDGFNCFQLSN